MHLTHERRLRADVLPHSEVSIYRKSLQVVEMCELAKVCVVREMSQPPINNTGRGFALKTIGGLGGGVPIWIW